MKKIRNPFYTTMLAVTLCAVALVGCSTTPKEDATATKVAESSSSPVPIDTYVGKVQQFIPKILDGIGAEFSALSITSDHKAVMIYSYTFAQQVDKPTTVANIDKLWRGIEATCEDVVIPEMAQEGVLLPGVIYVYLNADGSKVDSRKCGNTESTAAAEASENI